jgi:hypothetical protein
MQKATQIAGKTLSEQAKWRHRDVKKTYPQTTKKGSKGGMNKVQPQPPYTSCNPKKRLRTAKNSRYKKSKTKILKTDSNLCRPQKSKDNRMQKTKTLSARQNTP